MEYVGFLPAATIPLSLYRRKTCMTGLMYTVVHKFDKDMHTNDATDAGRRVLMHGDAC